ncbi:unnamed protein product, partial [Amoebophrya sp. A120]
PESSSGSSAQSVNTFGHGGNHDRSSCAGYNNSWYHHHGDHQSNSCENFYNEEHQYEFLHSAGHEDYSGSSASCTSRVGGDTNASAAADTASSSTTQGGVYLPEPAATAACSGSAAGCNKVAAHVDDDHSHGGVLHSTGSSCISKTFTFATSTGTPRGEHQAGYLETAMSAISFQHDNFGNTNN